MDYDKFKKERISSTKIKPYHMITAVTQRAINSQLAQLYEVNPTLQKMTLNSGDPDDDYSALEADLDPPTIELRLGTENRVVIFCLNIKRATLKYLKIKGRKVLEEKVDLPSCVLALWVNLAFEVAHFTDLPKEVQSRLKVKNDYSIQQLLIDFTSASLARWDESRTTMKEHITDPTANGQFNVFMQTYFSALAKRKDDFVLHYLPLATTEGLKQYAIPTVPPTDITFQNLPFVTSDTDNGKPSDDNMLIYLQMTGNTPLPRELLPISANWVVPTPDDTDRYDGTVVLSREIFLEGWLLPRLAEFNRQSSYVVTDGWWKGTTDVEVCLRGHLGRSDATTDELLFKPATKDELLFTFLTGIPEMVFPDVTQPVDLPSGRLYGYKFTSTKDDNDGMWYTQLSSTTQNFLFIPNGYNKEGKCEIFLQGCVWIDYIIKIDIVPSSGSLKGTWITSIVFDGINDGELDIKVNPIKPVITENIDEAWLHKGDITGFSDPAKEGLNSLSMEDVANDMRKVFTDGWDFVLPGGGDFFIQKAVFNKEEDLLCELKYRLHA